MIKVLIFAKRRPDISRERLMEVYEQAHIPLTSDLVRRGKLPPLADYRRNYLRHDTFQGHSGPSGAGSGLDFDVITEVWFADDSGFAANRLALQNPEIAQMIHEDLASFLDIPSMRYILVDECRGGGEGA